MAFQVAIFWILNERAGDVKKKTLPFREMRMKSWIQSRLFIIILHIIFVDIEIEHLQMSRLSSIFHNYPTLNVFVRNFALTIDRKLVSPINVENDAASTSQFDLIDKSIKQKQICSF